jgi:hypothetical protein
MTTLTLVRERSITLMKRTIDTLTNILNNVSHEKATTLRDLNDGDKGLALVLHRPFALRSRDLPARETNRHTGLVHRAGIRRTATLTRLMCLRELAQCCISCKGTRSFHLRNDLMVRNKTASPYQTPSHHTQRTYRIQHI